MTQEDKDLLLKDIFGRIPYGVKCSYLDIEFNNTTHGNLEGFEYDEDKDLIFVIDGIGIYSEHVKPYLFPLSSMTEEQDKEFALLQTSAGKEGFLYAWNCANMMKWLIENHFDYNGLIEKGLAIDATNKNIY